MNLRLGTMSVHSSKDLKGLLMDVLVPSPMTYNSVRPHHLVVMYSAYSLILKNSKVYQAICNKILSILSNCTDLAIPLIQYGIVPDALIRWGIRVRLADHLNLLRDEEVEAELASKSGIINELKTMPVAVNTQEANDQHYEVPAKFYDLCLGPCKKYSSGLWPSPETTFAQSEIYMLDLYCERAQIEDGMKIVDLGCGWGSMTLHLASKYPNAKITGISNSHSQREYILRTATDRGLNVDNINIITCNVSDDKGALDVVRDNDRVVSIEM